MGGESLKQGGRALVVLVATLVLVVACLRVNPFRYTTSALAAVFGGHAGSGEAVVQHVDPASQETSNGGRPGQDLATIARAWRADGIPRIYLIGNSQTYTTVLALDERASKGPEKVYVDLLWDRYRASGSEAHFYRLAVPNLSYSEAFWYLLYLTSVPELKPTQVVLQLNYESLRKSGIRDGLLELLAVEPFRETIRRVARGRTLYAPTFEQSLQRYEELSRQRADLSWAVSAAQATDGRAPTKGAAASSLGNVLETRARQLLFGDAVLQSRRHEIKQSFLTTVYLLRVYLLNIRPTTPRSIGGAPLAMSRAALDALAKLCRQNGVDLVVFNAPQNPRAPLYRTEADQRLYREIIGTLARDWNLRLLEFETSIPSQYWGVWIDGPDPIHLGRRGHELFAGLMYDADVLRLVRR